MNDLSTASSADIRSLIGALELGGHLESYGDGVLEAAGANASLSPSQVGECHRTAMLRVCIGDGVLEAAGANLGLGPQTNIRLGTACR